MLPRNEQKLLNVPECIPCCCIKQPTNAVCLYADGFILEIIYSFFSLCLSFPLFMFGFGRALTSIALAVLFCVSHVLVRMTWCICAWANIDVYWYIHLYWCWYVDVVQEIHLCECDWHSDGSGLVWNARHHVRVLVANVSLTIIFAFNLMCCVYARTFESTAKSVLR